MTEYRHNSHADVIVSRLLLTDMLDGTGRDSPLKLASLYTDQKPANDISRLLAASHRFPIKSSIAETLTLGTGKLAVEGVLLVAEHGDYPLSATGNRQYPKRRFWDETIRVFRESGRVVPVFIDKHLSDNWEDAQPHLRHRPGAEDPPDGRFFDPGGLARPARRRRPRRPHHADRRPHLPHDRRLRLPRAGGRPGAGRAAPGRGDRGAAPSDASAARPSGRPWTSRSAIPSCSRPPSAASPHSAKGEALDRDSVPAPKLMIVEYEDGLRVFLFELNGAVGDWTAAWRYEEDRRMESTLFSDRRPDPAPTSRCCSTGSRR